MKNKYTILRITTVPISLEILLKGQLNYMSDAGFTIYTASGLGSLSREFISSESIKEHFGLPLVRQINPFKDILALVACVKLLKKVKPDIVHTHTPKAGLIGMLASWIVGVPVRMHTVAGLPLMQKSGLLKYLLIILERIVYFLATDVYVNSKGLLEYINTNISASKKLQVLLNGSSNGINTSFFDRNQVEKQIEGKLKNQLGISNEDFVYVYIGRLVGDKGLNELVSAFTKVLETKKKSRLILVGEFENELDPLEENTLNLIKRNPRIMHVGFQKDVRPFLFVSQVLVFPSYREGFPNVVMQAGAMGLPSIVTDINGSNEIIKNGINGYIIPLKSKDELVKKMIEVQENSCDLVTMGGKARRMILERYEQSLIWEVLEKEYKRKLNLVCI